jgi:predicted dienelactone hydrolase
MKPATECSRSLCAQLAVLILGIAGLWPCHAHAEGWTPDAPLHKVATLLVTWHDPTRNRDIPAKIYYPADISGRCPLIIFSHGLGGSREGYSYLGERWAGAGYISVHVQHLGSDDALWRGAGADGLLAMTRAVANPSNAINRALDVTFVIDRMLELNKADGGPLAGHIDSQEIGVAGHSFGAWTTMAVLGEAMKTGVTFLDPRIKAGIAMSTPVVGGAAHAAGEFTNIKVPVFHMTGTLDDSPIGDTKAAERRIPYDQAATPGTCLLVLTGADHMTFSGHAFAGMGKDDARYQALILPASVAFWDATLRGDAGAKEWLYGGGFAKLLGTQGTFEKR